MDLLGARTRRRKSEVLSMNCQMSLRFRIAVAACRINGTQHNRHVCCCDAPVAIQVRADHVACGPRFQERAEIIIVDDTIERDIAARHCTDSKFVVDGWFHQHSHAIKKFLRDCCSAFVFDTLQFVPLFIRKVG